MSTTVRPDNLRAALDAKLAAAMSQLVELREAEQPRVTLHLNPREIVGTFLLYACRVPPIADTFGRAQAGDLQFDAWYGQWTETLGDADRALWKQLREERVRQELGQGTALIESRDFRLVGPFDHRASADRPAREADDSQEAHPLRCLSGSELRATSATTTCDWRGASRTTSSATTPGFSP